MKPQETYDSALADPNCDITAHLPYLRAVAKGRILEIGVRGGASTSAFLCGLEERGGHLYSVDIDIGCGAKFAGHPNWTFFHADSRKDGEVVRGICAHQGIPIIEGMLKPMCLDILFVDGDHEYETVVSDLVLYSQMVRPGGLIMMHDVACSFWPGVKVGMQAFLRNCDWQHEIHEGSNGLAVIKVPGKLEIKGEAA